MDLTRIGSVGMDWIQFCQTHADAYGHGIR
jgi:hypothetical protein